jgi:ABC-type dipeptide/oligopeptide/nickel transport system permease subunit
MMAIATQTGLLGPSRSPAAGSILWKTAARGLAQRRAVIGFGLVLALTGAAAGAGLLAPHDPVASDLGRRLLTPSAEYPLGTDWIGRCLLSRLLYGLRLTMLVGVVTVLAGGGLGVTLGLVAGFYGRLWETVIMRVADLLLSFPYFLLTIVLVAVLGASLLNAMVAIAVWTMPHFVRIVRAVTLSLREREFVEAARALGRTEPGILLRHVLPGCAAPLVVQASVFCAQNMLMSASLSFLGLGAQPPSPELGAMLAAGRAYLRVAPQVVAVPAGGILLAVLAFNLLGDALRGLVDRWTLATL